MIISLLLLDFRGVQLINSVLYFIPQASFGNHMLVWPGSLPSSQLPVLIN
jgi:hypothetical protein